MLWVLRLFERPLRLGSTLQNLISVGPALSAFQGIHNLNATGVAKRLQQSIPNSIILNQYLNEDNPLAHELTTGPEIIDAIVADYTAHSLNSKKSSGKVDVVIIGAGTGGTITGVSRAIKKVHNPDCHIVGVDPVSPCT